MFPKIAAVPLYILTESSQTGVPDHRNRAFFPHIPVIPNAGKDPLPRRKSPAKTQLHRAWKQKKTPSPGTETGVSNSVKRQGHLSVLCDVKMLDDALLLQLQQGL